MKHEAYILALIFWGIYLIIFVAHVHKLISRCIIVLIEIQFVTNYYSKIILTNICIKPGIPTVYLYTQFLLGKKNVLHMTWFRKTYNKMNQLELRKVLWKYGVEVWLLNAVSMGKEQQAWKYMNFFVNCSTLSRELDMDAQSVDRDYVLLQMWNRLYGAMYYRARFNREIKRILEN